MLFSTAKVPLPTRIKNAVGGPYSFGWWKETDEIEVPDSTGIRRQAGIHQATKGAKGSNYAPELTVWLVSTLLSVSTRRRALTVSSKGQTVCR
jgi:hypothetical protein